MNDLQQIKLDIRKSASKKRAKALAWFFKAGKGEYGEGDVFLGVTVPQQRQIAKKHKTLPLAQLVRLLHSKEHEFRLTALLIMVGRFEMGTADVREKVFTAYLKNTKWINNWDLVDLSAPRIVGAYLLNQRPTLLFRLAKSFLLWERRIAVLATFAFINKKQPEVALQIAERLLNDKHDLIHKAVGWMLREVGKRCGIETEIGFLDKHHSTMPRTMLRYAIERLREESRQRYLKRPGKDEVIR